MRLSVAMTTFNGVTFVEEQIVSILTQTTKVDEIVVSDDGSTDGTLARLAALRTQAGHAGVDLTVIAQGDHAGVTANFERAVAATTGDVIFLADQDDVWHTDRVETALGALSAGTLLQHADADLVDGDGTARGAGLFASLHVTAAEKRAVASPAAFGVYLRRNLATGAVTLFRRELLTSASPFPPEWVHDEWLAAIAAAHSSIQLLDRRLIDYRQHGNNQIGVDDPGTPARLGRMLRPRADRYERLAARTRVLEERLRHLALAPHVLAQAVGKREFEEARAQYPAGRLARLRPILARWIRGDYRRYSSQRGLDVIRDLAQPA